jgi:serine/threonine protein kinase
MFTRYCPPEIVQRQDYDFKVDYWSLGWILYTYFDPKTDILRMQDEDLQEFLAKSQFSFKDPTWINVSPYAKDFIDRLLYFKPKRRISGMAVLGQAWLNRKLLIKKMAQDEKQKRKRLQLVQARLRANKGK